MLSLAQNYLNRGFWGDEAWTSLISQLPYTQMLKTTAADFHPPGYYTIIEILYKFFPPTEIATRSVSIVFYLLTIFTVYKLASYVRGKTFGALSALFVAINPIFFTYAFEARNYTMFAFAVTGSMFFLIELSKKFTKARAIAFVLFTVLGLYTHYYMFFILGAQGLYLLLFDRKIIIRMMVLYAACGLLFLPWVPLLWGQLTSVKSSYWIAPVLFWNPLSDVPRSLAPYGTHFDAVLRILGGEGQSMYRDILFFLSILLLATGIIGHVLRHKFEKEYLLIWLWAIVPIVLATLPGLKVGDFQMPFRPIFFWRYLIGSSIPLAMVVVHSSMKLPKYVMYCSLGLVALLSVLINFATFLKSPYSFREAYGQEVFGKIGPEDKIVTVLPSFAEVLYYRNRFEIDNDLVVLPEGLVQFSGKSLLDAYEANGVVKIEQAPSIGFFEAIRDSGGQIRIRYY